MDIKELKKEIIEKVSLYNNIPNNIRAIYSDGNIEDYLLKYFKKASELERKHQKIAFNSWKQEYYLSPLRHNLLKWLEVNSNLRALEIGCGCGAMTGLLCDKFEQVTAIEYSYKRAQITAYRHKDRNNLEIIAGSLLDFNPRHKYDYIIAIGVLEYAEKFYAKNNPYISFMHKIESMLNDNGTIIIAIENKIGLKYFAGAPEDHSGVRFESIYDYPGNSKAKTFCKRELEKILFNAGIKSLYWYYPFPDYKIPHSIVSDDICLKENDPIFSVNSKNSNNENEYIFKEGRARSTLYKSGAFGEFANSFLIFGKKDGQIDENRIIKYSGPNYNRKRGYRTESIIIINNGKRYFAKKRYK